MHDESLYVVCRLFFYLLCGNNREIEKKEKERGKKGNPLLLFMFHKHHVSLVAPPSSLDCRSAFCRSFKFSIVDFPQRAGVENPKKSISPVLFLQWRMIGMEEHMNFVLVLYQTYQFNGLAKQKMYFWRKGLIERWGCTIQPTRGV
jgi:hypothetical protein